MARTYSRRQFIKMTAGGVAGLYVGSRLGGFTPVARAALPGGDLDLGILPKYVTPMLIPPAMPPPFHQGDQRNRPDRERVIDNHV